jgi:hypothetical protein
MFWNTYSGNKKINKPTIMKKLILIIIVSGFVNCSNDENRKTECINDLSVVLGIPIPENCELLSYKSSGALGDLTNDYVIKFPKPTFDSLFQFIDTNSITYDSKRKLYFYKTFRTKNETYSITFSKEKSTIYYNYNYE